MFVIFPFPQAAQVEERCHGDGAQGAFFRARWEARPKNQEALAPAAEERRLCRHLQNGRRSLE